MMVPVALILLPVPFLSERQYLYLEIAGTNSSFHALTDAQKAKLSEVRKAGSHLFRVWELKEDLRAVFQTGDADEASNLLDSWLRQASYCRIEQVVEVAKKVRRRREDIIAAVELGISNARVEAINNKIKVTVKMGYGFRNTDNLIALLMLRCSDSKPKLSGRPVKSRPVKKAA